MAGADSDAESLKRLLNETAAACQKCLVAVNQQQASVTTTQSADVSFHAVHVNFVWI